MSVVDRIWFGDDAVAAAGRAVLWPLSVAYSGVMRLRGRLYDAGVLPSEEPVLPAISVGNLTVGGTGKTPIAAWLAGELSAQAHPAIVLRGYGGDEIEVHRRLNPGVPIIANPDRAEGVAAAKQAGADVVVLDDAFQHRRVARQADILVLSAEQMLRPRRLLPAGPWREPVSALRRADLVVVTRKSADAGRAAGALALARQAAPEKPLAVVHLAPRALASTTDGEIASLDRVRGANVLAIAAIGEPTLFARQLEALGARVTVAAFRDHHAFTDADVAALARQAGNGLALCTLKDAVKLADRWPGPSRLWYVSQQLVVDQGAEHVTRLINRVVTARAAAAPSAG
jgi:tetraacyldisaccharide 4'-kinase